MPSISGLEDGGDELSDVFDFNDAHSQIDDNVSIPHDGSYVPSSDSTLYRKLLSVLMN